MCEITILGFLPLFAQRTLISNSLLVLFALYRLVAEATSGDKRPLLVVYT